MPGIDFAGNGGDELTCNQESTKAQSASGGGSAAFDTPTSDETKYNNVPTNSGRSEGSTSGPIEFVGDI
jgi:hypothetical protein